MANAKTTTKKIETGCACTTPHGFEFGAVVAGSIVALAITVVLTQFAMAIGYTDDTPLRGEGFVASWGVIAVGVWMLLTQLTSSLIGGYLTGRLRPVNSLYTAHEIEMRDGMHGLITWGLSSLIVFGAVSFMSVTGTGMLIADETTAIDELSRAEENSVIIYGFIHASMSLVAGAISWWAATMGGHHRDQGTDFSYGWSFRSKV